MKRKLGLNKTGKILAAMAASGCAIMTASTAMADPVKWELDASSTFYNVSITGTFIYDADTNIFSNIDIFSTERGGIRYTLNSPVRPGTANSFDFFETTPPDLREAKLISFRFFGGDQLTNAGGVYNLTDAGEGGIEIVTYVCINSDCSNISNDTAIVQYLGGEATLTGTPIVPPTANAGSDQSVRRLGDTVTLDGSASFDDNTASGDLLYAWRLTSVPPGSTAALSGADTAMPSFVADKTGTFIAELIVTDEDGDASNPDEVVVSTANLAPTADAGSDLVVPVGDIVVLDGSASSDPEGMTLSYAWSLSAVPAGSNATLANTNSAAPNLIPDKPGLYEATLVVSDNLGPSAPDSAEITAVARGDFASMKIACAADLIAGLPESVVKTKGNQKALLNYLAAAAKAVQRPDYDKAIERIEFALQRTDGCAINGVPDGNGAGRDWVETCAAQLEINRCLNEARGALD